MLKGERTKISYTAAAHDPVLSKEEHERIGYSFNLPHLSDPNLFDLYLHSYRLADIVICPSIKSGTIMSQRFGCKNVAVINHGITNPVVESAPLPMSFRVGYLGQCGADKGIPYLMQATKATGHRLVMAGRHTDAMLDMWRRFGGGPIELKGFVQSPSHLYNICSVYCQPSVTEAWGIEVLEAMAHGRPVICSEGAGASEAIEHGVDGFVVPIRDPNAIAEYLTRLSSDRDLLTHMGENAKKKASKYGWDVMRSTYVGEWRMLSATTV
jgi:glycosyltransferase involved in cell wall biosynthesis